MSSPGAALAHVRALYASVDAGAVALAAELLTAAQSAADVLAPIADEDTPAGIAFQILADVIAGAVPLDQSQQPARIAEQEQVQR